MATPTTDHSRGHTLVGRIAKLDADPARLEAVALGLVDGMLDGHNEILAAALDALRDARARATGDQALLGRPTRPSPSRTGTRASAVTGRGGPGTQAHDFLRALDGSPQLGSTERHGLLEVDESQVSRTGRRLLESGLVTRLKVGRQVFWRLTPRGQRALEEAPAPKRSRNSDFWQEALRRGFETAAGEEPREPRRVDPTRERIIESALELHRSRGIQVTTWAEIAAEAGVPVETVKALFPTQDDLVRSCGAHFIESLQLPPHERVPEVFAGASSENARLRRLVETFFGVYERGADGITVARRERKDVPAADESMEALDNTLDALVVEALRPLPPHGSSVVSVRALTDLEVWRTLRDEGATPGAAVNQASATVERWLEARRAA